MGTCRNSHGNARFSREATCPDAARNSLLRPGAVSSWSRGRRAAVHLPPGRIPEPLPIHHCQARRPAWLPLLPPLTEEQRGSWAVLAGRGRPRCPAKRTLASFWGSGGRPSSSVHSASWIDAQQGRAGSQASAQSWQSVPRAPTKSQSLGGHGVGQESLCDPALPWGGRPPPGGVPRVTAASIQCCWGLSFTVHIWGTRFSPYRRARGWTSPV